MSRSRFGVVITLGSGDRSRWGIPGLWGLLALGGLAACTPQDGAVGEPGLSGPRGDNGPPGPDGPAGVRGPAGPTGPAGPIGPAGVDGVAGPRGAAGPQGLQGTMGVRGPVGPAGTAGMVGAAGAIGAIGPVGPAGPDSPTQLCAAGQGLVRDANNAWVCGSSLASLTRGRTRTNPGTSCADIKTVSPRAEDGAYLVDPDGNGPIGQLRVLCDMTRDGGGWTLILKNRYQSGMHGRGDGYGTLDDLEYHQADFYKLSDANVNAIIGDGKFDLLVDQTGYNSSYSNGNHEYAIVRNYTAAFSFTARVPESSTVTVFESYRASDGMLNWRGRLACGNVGGVGVNCNDLLVTGQPVGAVNPQGGAGCLGALGGSSNVGWHQVYMSDTNTDTYLYLCNSAQHSSSHDLSHRWWVR